MKFPTVAEAVNLYGLAGVHPAADCFPMLPLDDLVKLAEHAQRNGWQHAVTVDSEGLLLDGRNRLIASVAVDKDVPIVVLDPPDVVEFVLGENDLHRHLDTGQRAMVAKKLANLKQGGQPANSVTTPSMTQAEAAKLMDVSLDAVKRAKAVSERTPDLAPKVESGEMSLNAAYQVAKEVPRPNAKPQPKTFNKTNENVDWVQWTWNPVTGCAHDCDYCYARDINARFAQDGFAPTLHEERLDAPANTTPGDGTWASSVFTVSMGDLWGEWVPGEWIDKVLDSVRQNPQWNFLMLTKNPSRYLEFEIPPNVWLGATVDCQARVTPTAKAFLALESQGVENVRWVSCEPMLEPIELGALTNYIDWLVVGGASASTRTPASAPAYDWWHDLYSETRYRDIAFYMKPNLIQDASGKAINWTARVREYPEVAR